jgi:hypothetical protein
MAVAGQLQLIFDSFTRDVSCWRYVRGTWNVIIYLFALSNPRQARCCAPVREPLIPYRAVNTLGSGWTPLSAMFIAHALRLQVYSPSYKMAYCGFASRTLSGDLYFNRFQTNSNPLKPSGNYMHHLL